MWFVVFYKQKTAYEMRISDWSSDVCSSDLVAAADGADADLVVLNTGHIREKAAEKVYSDIGRLKREDGSTPTIAVAGCVAQAEGAEIARRAPSVDIVVGPQAYHRLPRSEERRDGNECVSTCRSRGSLAT